MAKRLRLNFIKRVALVPRGADQDADIVLAKSAEDVDDAEGNPMPETLNEVMAKLIGEDAALGEDEVKALNAIAEKATKGEGDPPVLTDEDVERGYVEIGEQRYTLAKAEGDADPDDEPVEKSEPYLALQKQHDEGIERIQKMEDERDLSVRVSKAQAEYPHLPGTTPPEMAAALEHFAKGKGTEADLELVEAVLIASSAAIREGALFTERGSGLTSEGVGDDIEKIAKAIEEKDPDLTPQQAMAKALSSPEAKRLYDEREVPQAQGA